MKRKTINAVISKKMNDWINSIDDEELRNKLKKDVIVTGGAITSMLLNEKVNDFDVYFKTKETTRAVAEYYVSKFNAKNESRMTVLDDAISYKSNMEKVFGADKHVWMSKDEYEFYKDRVYIFINSKGIAEDSDFIADENEYNIEGYLKDINDIDEMSAEVLNVKKDYDEKYRPVFLSANAITLSDKVQLVVRFYGEPEEIHKNYDFIHTTSYWTFGTGVVLNQKALEAILNKELFYHGSKYPIASLIRTRKFIKRGWQINASQYLKMAWQISELDLTNIHVLQDQLTGVDSIYFTSFIDILKKQTKTNKDFVLTGSYVATVVDRIFG